MIHVRMGEEPARNAHEFPRLPTEIKPQFILGDSPERHDGRPREPFDREVLAFDLPIGRALVVVLKT